MHTTTLAEGTHSETDEVPDMSTIFSYKGFAFWVPLVFSIIGGDFNGI